MFTFETHAVKWNCAQILLFGIAVLATHGCSSTMHPAKEVIDGAERNRNNLLRLETGFNETQVLEIMGSPYTIERFPKYAKHLDYWLYFTDSAKGVLDPGYTASNYTFLAFERGILRQWGRDFEVIPVRKDNPLRQELYPE